MIARVSYKIAFIVLYLAWLVAIVVAQEIYDTPSEPTPAPTFSSDDSDTPFIETPEGIATAVVGGTVATAATVGGCVRACHHD